MSLPRPRANRRTFGSTFVAIVVAVFAFCAIGNDGSYADAPAQVSVSDIESSTAEHLEATFVQPPAFLTPETPSQPEVAAPDIASELESNLFGTLGLRRSLLSTTSQRALAVPSAESVFGGQARGRVTTDGGNLLRESPGILNAGVQRRTPIVNDPRIRGSRVGAMPSAGSYWVPARIDLDTMLSKIESRIIGDVFVLGGPYSVRFGPGFSFLDVTLQESPRFLSGPHYEGLTSFDFKGNGEQWHGRQDLWGGAADWGVRAGYSHRTGNDYRTGGGQRVPSSYNSREFNLSVGRDWTDDRSVELSVLRLDQTGIEYPGQAFDMDYLVTDGYDLKFDIEDPNFGDRLQIEAWYNRTRFEGDNLGAGKRATFPIYDFVGFEAFTDVDSSSAGYRALATWGCDDGPQLAIGTDLRLLKTELNEISSGVALGIPFPFTDRNSMIPDSFSANPGVFVDQFLPVNDCLSVTVGGRFDWVRTDIVDDAEKLAEVGTGVPFPATYDEIVGTDEYRQDFFLWSAFLTGTYEINDCWTATGGVGYAQRPPTLTELYAAEPFMFLLQNGLNTVTGDPRLSSEKLWQVDLGLRFDGGYVRGGVTGFHGWMRDYITFENLGTLVVPDLGEQVNLKYVNTARATRLGGEAFGEVDLTPRLTSFATLKYVQATDRARDGDFATMPGSAGNPSVRVPGLPRGSFGGGPNAGNVEPLPGILPLESRIGLRVHEASSRPAWGVELTARFVTRQDRVAASLLETPTPGFSVWDVRGYWRPRDHWLIVGGAENFTDKDYREHLDFRSLASGISISQPGVNFYVGSEVQY